MRDWDWVGAEKEFKRALELDPSNVNIRHWYALYLAAMGRREDAFRESREALRLDPSSLSIQTGAGAIEYFARDYKQMIKQMQSTVALGPNFAPGYDWLGMAYVQVGRFEEAIAVYQKAVTLSGGSAEVKAGLGHAYGVAGQRASARAILGELNDLAKKKYVPPVQIAFVYLGLGDRAHALDLLEKAYQERSWELVFIQVEPWVDSLRSDPRFRDIVRRMNFPK
jgi:Flp pilus assembly protein TadD